MKGRVCPGCGHYRALETFSPTSQGQGWKAEDGSYRYSYCKYCSRKRVKEYYSDPGHREARKQYMRAYHAAHKDDPDYIAQRRAYYQSERGQELTRKRKERWEARIRSNPRLLASVLEQRRLWSWEARRRAGARETPSKGRRVSQREVDLRLPREPFVEWLERKEKEYGRLDLLSEVIGLSVRTIRRIQHGEDGQKRVSIDTVDTALTREGSTGLWQLYGDLYPDDECEESVAA